MNLIIRVLELKRFTFEDFQKLHSLQTEMSKVNVSAFQLIFTGSKEFRKLTELQDEVFHKYNINQVMEKAEYKELFKKIETFNSGDYQSAIDFIKEKSGETKREEEERLRFMHIEIQKKNEALRIEKLTQNQISILSKLDSNNDGQIDLIENDFNKLFAKNQKRVMDIDKNYVHQFVKVSNFIKTKKQNTQNIFESIRGTSTQQELEERVNLLRNQIHSYELLVYHSINMIGALVSEDLITFYEIYESFDKLGIFNSNWENEVSEKLKNIGDKLDDLMHSIYNMEQNIVSELSHLSYVTQESFEDLNRSVTGQLKEVESSINTNNLLTGIQTYQLYKIDKNTRGLR
jgi:hypothetical protein